MADSASDPTPIDPDQDRAIQQAMDQAMWLQKFVQDSTKGLLPQSSNAIKFEGDFLDDDLKALSEQGYATQALLAQILRETKGLREDLKPEVVTSGSE